MAGDANKVSQDEIDELLRQAQGEAGQKPLDSADPRPGEGAAAAQQPTASASQAAPAPSAPSAPGAPAATADPPSNVEEGIAANDIEFLIQQAEQAIQSIDNPPEGKDAPQGASPQGVSVYRFAEFGGSPASTEAATVDLIREVELDLKIELGRTQMYLEDVLKLKKGAVVPLDKLAGDPVDIYVNGRLIARGEVLVLNDNFCVRVGELIVGETAKG